MKYKLLIAFAITMFLSQISLAAADGYQIKKEGDDKTVDLIFDKADKTWSVESDGETAKLLKFTEDDKVVMYLPDGKEMNVELNQAGVLAFRQIADNYNFFAAR